MFGTDESKYPGTGIWPGEGSDFGRRVHVGQPVASTAEAPVCQRSQPGCILSAHDYKKRTFLKVNMLKMNRCEKILIRNIPKESSAHVSDVSCKNSLGNIHYCSK